MDRERQIAQDLCDLQHPAPLSMHKRQSPPSPYLTVARHRCYHEAGRTHVQGQAVVACFVVASGYSRQPFLCMISHFSFLPHPLC